MLVCLEGSVTIACPASLFDFFNLLLYKNTWEDYENDVLHKPPLSFPLSTLGSITASVGSPASRHKRPSDKPDRHIKINYPTNLQTKVRSTELMCTLIYMLENLPSHC